MGRSSTSTPAPVDEGFLGEAVFGAMPGDGGCGCGCAAAMDEVAGSLPGQGRMVVHVGAGGVADRRSFLRGSARLEPVLVGARVSTSGLDVPVLVAPGLWPGPQLGSSVGSPLPSRSSKGELDSQERFVCGRGCSDGRESQLWRGEDLWEAADDSLLRATIWSDRGAPDRDANTHGRIASQGGPQSSEERQASQDAERTNAVFATGDVDLIGAWVVARESDDEHDLIEWWEEYGEAVWGPDPLYRPSESGLCDDEFKGGSHCSYLAVDISRGVPDLDEYASRDVPVAFIDERASAEGCEAELRGLVRAAWSLLQDNLDLVEWTRCWVFGRSSSGRPRLKCLERALDGSNGDVEITLRDGVSPFNEYAAADGWCKRGIIIYHEQIFWRRRLSNWCCGPDDETRLCMLISVASSMLHELVHYCCRARDVGEGQECHTSYLTQSVIEWALFHRYDVFGGGTCCDTVAQDDTVFAYGAEAADVGDCGVLTCP